MQYLPVREEDYESISRKYHVSDFVARVVSSFAYTDEETASFFMPEHYGRPQNACLARAATLLEEIKREGQRVFIYGDYDCDGICATTIMTMLLERLGIQSGYYIPNRLNEGYGLNLERLKQAREKGYDVLITVDNGVSAIEELNWARGSGMKVIVTDHHLIQQEVPCDVLVHPETLPKGYQHCCGAAVAYALADSMNLADDRMKMLAMVATIGDVMELKGYNVQLVREGLDLINKKEYLNILSLNPQLSFPINEEDISFRIVPVINAVGRMADRANSNNLVRYLLSHSPAEISSFAGQINDLNAQRKALSSRQYEMIKDSVTSDDFLVICLEGLHEGLLGLFASRLTDEYNKPCLVLTPSDGVLKGSGRSIASLNIVELLQGFPHLERLGGHRQACGLALKPEYLDELKEYLRDNYTLEESCKYYLEVSAKDLSRKNLDELYSYAPFGQGRRIPLLRVRFDDICDFRHFRTDYQLCWNVRCGDDLLKILSFKENNGYDFYLSGREIEVIGELRMEVFRGKVSYSLNAVKIY